MFRSILILFFLFYSSTAVAQLPVLQWVKVLQKNTPDYGDGLSNGRSVAVDQSGNVYSVGMLNGTIDCDPGPGVFNLTAAGPFNKGIYISKLDANGQFIWAGQLPVLIEFSEIDLALDNAGNIYISAYISTPADMDPGPGVYTVTPIGGKDAFIVKLDPNGNLIWVRQFGGPGDTVAQPSFISIDAAGNVYTSGVFINTVDFDPGPGVANISTNNHWDGYISKISPNGDFIWAKRIGDFSGPGGNVLMRRVVTDPSGNCYFSGTFSGTCDFDPSAAQQQVVANGPMDGFICSFDVNGNFRWVKLVGNSLMNYYADHRTLCIDKDNNLYTSGSFIGTHDFDPGPGTFNLSSASGTSPYLLKLDALGNFIWARKLQASGTGYGADIMTDLSGAVYVSANYLGDTDLGPGTGTTFFANLYDDNILTKYSPDGQLLYAAPFLRTPDGYALFRRMATDPAANIYVTGYYYGNIDFDPGPTLVQITGNGPQNPFILKLSKCTNPSFTTLTINACNTYTLNGKSYTQTGTYYQTLLNAAGCDSLITLNLTILRKFTNQQKQICAGQTFFAGGKQQTTTGTYIDTLVSAAGCDSIVTTQLTVNPVPAPMLGNDRSICEGTALILDPGTFSSYLWQDGSTTGQLTVSTPGTYSVTVTNNFGCSRSDTIKVLSLLSPPKDFLKATDSVCTNGKLQLVPLANYSNYTWSSGSNQKILEITSPGTYRLTVTDANGCTGSDTILVYPKTCAKGVFFPSAFTPNTDGRNDVFRALVFGRLVSFRLEVYNRWGERVFITQDASKGWDGIQNGKLLPTGGYSWVCRYQFENEAAADQKGTVILIR